MFSVCITDVSPPWHCVNTQLNGPHLQTHTNFCYFSWFLCKQCISFSNTVPLFRLITVWCVLLVLLFIWAFIFLILIAAIFFYHILIHKLYIKQYMKRVYFTKTVQWIKWGQICLQCNTSCSLQRLLLYDAALVKMILCTLTNKHLLRKQVSGFSQQFWGSAGITWGQTNHLLASV